MRLWICVVALLGLAGCASSAVSEANQSVKLSLGNYKTCLDAHPRDVSPCEGARLSYLADRDNAERLQRAYGF